MQFLRACRDVPVDPPDVIPDDVRPALAVLAPMSQREPLVLAVQDSVEVAVGAQLERTQDLRQGGGGPATAGAAQAPSNVSAPSVDDAGIEGPGPGPGAPTPPAPSP